MAQEGENTGIERALNFLRDGNGHRERLEASLNIHGYEKLFVTSQQPTEHGGISPPKKTSDCAPNRQIRFSGF